MTTPSSTGPSHQPGGSDIFNGLKYRRVLAHADDEVGNGGDASASVTQFQNIVVKNNATQMSPTFVNAIRGISVGYLTPGQVFVSNNSDLNVQDDEDNRVVIFTNVDAGNLTLRAGAPAIDKGVPVAPYTNTDILGNARPKGAAIDLGTYELF